MVLLQRNSVVFLGGLLWAIVSLASGKAIAEVVINEIFYNAPDELEDLEYVELLNNGAEPVDISAWTLSGEIKFTFPANSILKPGEIIVIAKEAEILREFYKVDAHGEFKKSLSNSGGKLTLSNADGETVETLRYGDNRPWPLAADGYSASIERICAAGPASQPSNWAPSTLSGNYDRTPSGSPGTANSVAADETPPAFSSVDWRPKQLRPGQTLAVRIKMANPASIRSAELRYRHAGPGSEGKEQSVALRNAGDLLVAEIPAGRDANRLLRFRIVAQAVSGGVGYYPHPNEVRPAFTVFVSDKLPSALIPIAQLIFVDGEGFEASEQYRKSQTEPPRRSSFGFPGRRPDFRREDTPANDESADRSRDRGGFRGRAGRFGPPGFPRSFPAAALRPQGNAALIFTDPASGKAEVFDFVNITRRKSGWKIRLHKDHLLDGMKTLNVLYEADERTVLNELLAYQLYELAGNKTCKHGFTRLTINGAPAGYHLYFEQPNKAFLRRNKIDDDGDLYKLIWMGNAEMSPRVPEEERSNRRDITGRYEKKTNRHRGHQDLVEVVEALESAASDEETWRIIEENFDVDQMINYFAVNSLISHWDGFFNNFFVYYDREGTGKWTIYPWDQDSTWSQRGGPSAELYRLPLFFGAEGATPDGVVKINRDQPRRSRGGFEGFGGFGFRGPGGRSFMWWRPGGDFSRPMLANPTFYKRFRSRLDELTREVFTPEGFGPRIDALKMLGPEIRLRAELRQADEDAAIAEFRQTIAALHEHLAERRAFVRAQLKEDN